MRLGGNGHGDGIDSSEHLGGGRHRRVHEPRNLPRARLVDIDDAHQLHVGKLRQNPRVVFPESADADHRHASFHDVLTTERTERTEFFS